MAAPLDYMVHKLNQNFSKRELLKFVYYQFNEDDDDNEDMSRFVRLFIKLSREYIGLNEEEKENELMAMEDKNEGRNQVNR